jgi:hypothetical protein
MTTTQNDEFAVFILTHGRPDNVKTFKTLKKCNYTGRIYFVVDNEDKTVQKYIENFGSENVKVFDKFAISETFDEGNNFEDRKTIVYARNACFQIAKEEGLKYFVQLDDDYVSFEFRYISPDGKKLLVDKRMNLDVVFQLHLDFFKSTPFNSIAFAQGGDFIGGIENPYVQKRPLLRKCMNSFICSIDRPFQFIGSINEDVNTYTTLGSRGVLFGTVPMVSLVQTATQSSKSGMTEAYLRFGTYCKSFTTVIMQPSSVKVAMMSSSNPRIHHSISWLNTTPFILDEKHRKEDTPDINV